MSNKILRGIEVLCHPPFTPLVLETDEMAWERKLFRLRDKSVRTHLRGTWMITPSFLMAYK
jgi:hypothetical protein